MARVSKSKKNEFKEFFEAVNMMAEEKGIDVEYLYDRIANAIVVALRRDYGGKEVVFCDIDPEAQTMRVYVRLNVVDNIEDEDVEILIEDVLITEDELALIWATYQYAIIGGAAAVVAVPTGVVLFRRRLKLK